MLRKELNNFSPIYLGIVGGMGPLASAEFVKTIYSYSQGKREQDKIKLCLLSDPTIPDRTYHILKKEEIPLLEALEDQIQTLRLLGTTHIIICCVTIHAILPLISNRLLENVVSLVDVIMRAIRDKDEEVLFLCTRGTYELAIIKNHYLWREVENRVKFLSLKDQEYLHQIIYDFKQNHCYEKMEKYISNLEKSYGTKYIVAGFTEIHPIVNLLKEKKLNCGSEFIDPLHIVAKELNGLSGFPEV